MILDTINSFLAKVLPLDKSWHFISGTVLFAIGNIHSYRAGLILVVAMAVSKEIYDWFNKDTHTPDWKDAIATISGGVLGFLCTVPAFKL